VLYLTLQITILKFSCPIKYFSKSKIGREKEENAAPVVEKVQLESTPSESLVQQPPSAWNPRVDKDLLVYIKEAENVIGALESTEEQITALAL